VKARWQILYLAGAACVAWFGLALQAQVAFEAMWAYGLSTPAALAKFLSFFTILTNGLVALCYFADLVFVAKGQNPPRAWTNVRGGVAASIATVGLGYAILLRHLHHFEGWPMLANFLVHDATPVLFVVYWIGCVPKGTLDWRSPFLWLIYPALYLPWALSYGAATGSYPYPFLNVAQLGYPTVLVISAGLLVAFAAIAWLLVAIDRFWPGKAFSEKR
jgi:hypothetical protein